MPSGVQIRKVEGLQSLLESLSLEEVPGTTHRYVVYPWDEYSKVPGNDIGFWHSAEGCQYSTLRRLIAQRFKEIGHPTTDRLIDGLVMAFVLTRTADLISEFERLLDSFAAADVSQFLLLPASSLLRYIKKDEPPEHEVIGFFGHGPFHYAPLAGGLMEKVKYRFERIGVGGLLPDIEKFLGCIAVYRDPQGTKVIDFTGLGFKGHQPPEIVALIRSLFDDLAAALFEDFWKKHLETQYLSVAAGATFSTALCWKAPSPGTGWLSIFWGFDLLSAKGMISLITEETQCKGVLAIKVHSLGRDLAEAKHRMEVEIKDLAGPHRVYPSLVNFARLVARSRELQNRSYVEESFTLLMVAMESLLAERDSDF